MSQTGPPGSEPGPGVGTGPRTGSDPTNSAQEVAVLRAELRGLEGVLKERAEALNKALELQAREFERRLSDRAEALDKALTLQAVDYERRLEDRWANHFREHDNAREEITKAAAAVDRRLEGMNELRQQINTERGAYATRDLFDSTQRETRTQVGTNSDKLITLTAEVSSLREDLGALKSGQEWLIRAVVGAILAGVAGLLFSVLRVTP